MAQRNGETPSYSVTSAGVNPAEDRAHRMRMYFIAMSLRVVCVGSLFWVRGWWTLIPLAGAVILPWFAVMVGNAVAYGGEQEVDTLDPLEISAADPEPTPAAQDLLIVDVEPVRRSAPSAEPAPPSQTAPSAPTAEPSETGETGSEPPASETAANTESQA